MLCILMKFYRLLSYMMNWWIVTVFRYPIYHIPMGKTIKDLSTCFLTYHTLSSSFQGTSYYWCFTLHNYIYPFNLLVLKFTPRQKRIKLWKENMHWVEVLLMMCDRYGPWWWYRGREREEKRRWRNFAGSIWFGHV